MRMATQTASSDLDARRVWQALESVVDPEIPVVSVIEMGMIPDVTVDRGRVRVALSPTFAGCPAVDLIRGHIVESVRAIGFSDVEVAVVFDPPWTSDRITPEGRRKLKEFGLAPPPHLRGPLVESNFHAVNCPQCGSTDTTLESLFGPTLCRSIHYCNACRNSFEHMKPVG
jgi:ring-1,2-phenylacetyl-CoA epoxidase subunit PaaD